MAPIIDADARRTTVNTTPSGPRQRIIDADAEQARKNTIRPRPCEDIIEVL